MTNNSDDIQWITVDGQHIPIGAHESKDDAVKRFIANREAQKDRQIEKNKQQADELNADRKTLSTQEEHKKAIEELSKDKYQDGTYNISNYKIVEYDDGYQVTFCQIGDNYSAKEYDYLVSQFREFSSDGIVSAGKFESTPEISFHVASREQAVSLAKKYNQISIWDWKNCDEIKTGGTGRRK